MSTAENVDVEVEVEKVPDIQELSKQEGTTYAEDVDILEEKGHCMEDEIKRLSDQVLKLSAEKEAYKKHSKMLGDKLKSVRTAAAERHFNLTKELGVSLKSDLSISSMRLEQDADDSVKDEDHPHLKALELTAKDWRWFVNPDEVKLGRKIGEGATANIFIGEWHGLSVAVKCIKEGYLTSDKSALESYITEVELLIRQRHPFVLRLFGASFEYPARCWLVTELVPNGTLAEWLHGEKGRQWNRRIALPPLKERLRMALEVALAMQYMHEQVPCVIHRDLKPSNVFIDSSLHVRVADFGFARYFTREQAIMTGETGTYMYMAPEVIRHDHYDETCDVYSFGVMLNELLSGNPPFIETFLTPMQMAVGVMDGSLRPKPATGVDQSLISLVAACWAQEPAKRPSFAEIAVLLKSHVEAIVKKEGDAAHRDQRGGLFGFMHH